MPQRAAEIELLLPPSFALSSTEDCRDFKNQAGVRSWSLEASVSLILNCKIDFLRLSVLCYQVNSAMWIHKQDSRRGDKCSMAM